MWTGYSPNKKEREAIETAYGLLQNHYVGGYGALDRWMKEERRGYGNRNDAIPTIGAKALCVQWVLQGLTRHKNALLRDMYMLRPAAVWLIGKGGEIAEQKDKKTIEYLAEVLANAHGAHEAAFKRMMDKDHAALRASLEAARKPAAEIIAEAL